MNLKEILYLAQKNVMEKKGKGIIIILLVVSMTLIILSFSFKETINKYINDGIMGNSKYKTLFVTPKDDETEDEAISNLKKVDHVIDVFTERERNHILDLIKIEDKIMKGTFWIYGANDLTLPEISSGRGIENENEIVCPEIFYPSDDLESLPDLDKNKLIRMKTYLNKTLYTMYYITPEFNYDTSDAETEEAEEVYLELKLVGTYKNNPSYLDENICYGTKSLIQNISTDAYQNADNSNVIDPIIVIIDDVNNVKQVSRDIEKLGYAPSSVVVVNNSFIDIVSFLSYLIIIITIILSVSLIMFINKKRIDDKKSEVNVYRSLGFSKKNITKILYFESFYIGIISIVISSILIILTLFSLKYAIYLKPFIFQKIPVTLSSISTFISIVTITITLIITTISYKKKILSDNVIGNIKG